MFITNIIASQIRSIIYIIKNCYKKNIDFKLIIELLFIDLFNGVKVWDFYHSICICCENNIS